MKPISTEQFAKNSALTKVLVGNEMEKNLQQSVRIVNQNFEVSTSTVFRAMKKEFKSSHFEIVANFFPFHDRQAALQQTFFLIVRRTQ